MSLGLRTGNREVAARRAAELYTSFATVGVEATLARHRPKRPEAERIASVGEYLAAARSVSSVRGVTFGGYARSLRQVVAGILYPSHGRETKAIRAAVEAASLEVLTPEAVQAWRLAFVARAQGDARREKAACVSADSILRQAASLLSKKNTRFIGDLKLPEPLPFAGVERFKRDSSRYISRIDAGTLLRQARTQLAPRHPDAFLVVLLGLVGGLRRAEIDALTWDRIDLEGDRIIVDAEAHGRLKTPESHGAVDIDEHTVEVLRGFRARAASRFVIEGGRDSRSSTRRTWSRYRCESTFDFVNLWLRRQGVDSPKPLHTLRKESGSLVAQQHGLFQAQQHLRHRDVSTTARFYLDRKAKAAIDTAALLKADEGGPSNIISLSSVEPAETGKRPRRARRRIL
jgi:integrase